MSAGHRQIAIKVEDEYILALDEETLRYTTTEETGKVFDSVNDGELLSRLREKYPSIDFVVEPIV